MTSSTTSRIFPHVRDAVAGGKLQFVVILGLQRSGTSLLAAMLGRHPDVNMLYEAYTYDFFRAYGKPIAVNKLLIPHQIHMKRKASIGMRSAAYLLGRIPFLNTWIRHSYLIPTVHYSISDLRELGTRFIVLSREREKVLHSMMQRAGYSEKQANKEIEVGLRAMRALKDDHCYTLQFENLLTRPQEESVSLCSWLGIEYDAKMLLGPEFNTRYPNGTPLSGGSQ